LTIPNAVRTVLLQIASGIKHLHGLRIVHRALRPANILLADSHKSKRKGDMQESVFEIFSLGDYVAKISDMGLCKQLMGQNSFGGSATRESSLQIQAANAAGGGDTVSGAQSSIVGAGPGTVGWQAPEVMVMRMPRRVDYRYGAGLKKWPKPQPCSPH
jgi:serine/threonine protein kinase